MTLLLAQSAAPASTPIFFLVLVGLGMGAIAVLILVLLMMFRHLGTSRQLQHAERMKAIEAGYPLEDAEASKAQTKFMHNAFWISFWLGIGVPIVAFGAASSAERVISGNVWLGIAVWGGAAAASVAGVAGAVVLMISSRAGQQTNDVGMKSMKPKA